MTTDIVGRKSLATKDERNIAQRIADAMMQVTYVQKEKRTGMRYSISDTAEYGDLTRGSRIITEAVKHEMKEVLAEIQDGRFAAEWVKENEIGRPRYPLD